MSSATAVAWLHRRAVDPRAEAMLDEIWEALLRASSVADVDRLTPLIAAAVAANRIAKHVR